MLRSKKSTGIDKNNLDTQILKSITQLHESTLRKTSQLLSIWGMTPLQYYTLQILHKNNKEPKGMPSGEIGKQLTTRVPDMTRLLDRMADKDWLVKERDPNNRRLVRNRLTAIGIELVESASMPLLDLQSQILLHISPKDKKNLIALLHQTLNEKI